MINNENAMIVTVNVESLLGSQEAHAEPANSADSREDSLEGIIKVSYITLLQCKTQQH